MATATVTLASGTAYNSYFQFNKGAENGGYTYTSKNNGTMYIGQKSTSGDHSGVNCGSFPLVLYDLPNRTSMATIKSISFSIYTTTSSDGYNNCYARIEYIGAGDAAFNDYPGLWRCGAASERIFLKEGSTRSYTTTDATTIANFTNLIKNATSGTKYFFRIVKESGMGAVLKSGVTLSVTYSDGSVNVYNSGWKESVPYIWKTTNPTFYYYPEAAMTSDSSADCVTTASSVYNGSYPAWRSFDKDYAGYCWASTAADTERWLQITIPKPLYNIRVRIINPAGTNGPISGIIYGSNNGGTSITQIGSFSNRSAVAGVSSLVVCNNSSTAYNTIRVKCTAAGAINLNNVAIGQLLIGGTDVGSNGAWVKAKEMVWKTSNSRTYTYPASGMTSWVSQGCIACASTELNQNYPAWKAFNKATGTGDIWFSGDSPTPHWLQLTMPRPLYNIKVQIYNRFGNDHKGAIEGIIYGSNDNGATLTQIGSFTGRNPSYGTNSTVTCNNTNRAYSTVRLHITKWGDASGNPVTTLAMGVGAMFVTGTDIGANGGWSEVEDNTCPAVLLYPKNAMVSAGSQDCIVTGSTQYSGDYQPFYAFNRNTSSVWCTTNADTSPWLQIALPEPLYNISIILFNRVHSSYTGGGFIDFVIQGSKDNSALTQIYSTVGRNGATSGASSTHTIGNKTPYDTLKFIPSNWAGKGSNYSGMGEIFIFGTKQP